MKKSLFISRLLRALLAFAVFSQVQAKDITLTDSDYLVDPNEGYWYWKYWDTETQLYYLAYDFHVKTNKALVRNAGLSGPVYIYSGAKLTLAAADDDGNKAGELLQNTGNSSDSQIWKMLYEWGPEYRLSINMKDNSALDYRDQELYLGVLTIDKGAHVDITAGTFAARAIGNWDNDFTITANTSIQNSSGGAPTLWLGNGYTKSLTLERSLKVNLTVARDADKYSSYIDSTGKFHMPEGVYNPLGGGGGVPDFNKTRLDGGSILLPAFSDNTIEGYLRGTTKIYLGNKTRLNGLERSRGDGGTDISWLLNDIVVQQGCEAEMNKGYYGGTVTMESDSSLKFDVILVPAGVDDKQWAGGAKVVMTGGNRLNLAGRTTNVTLDAAAGTRNSVKNGVFTGTATVGAGGVLELDCALGGNPVINLKDNAKLFMRQTDFYFGALTINAEGKITFALQPGAPINGNVNIKYTGIDMGTAPVAEIDRWTSNGNTFTLAGMHGMFINSTVNGNTRIDTDTAVNFNGLVIKDALIVNYTKETLSTYAGWDVDMGEEVTGNLSVNAPNGRVKVGTLYGTGTVNALDIQVASFTGDRLELRSNRSVTLAGDIDASDKLVVSGLSSGKAAVSIQASITAVNAISLEGTSITGGNDNEIYSAPSYQINAQEDINLGGTFLGGDLTVTAGGAITLASLGSEANPITRAYIISTGAGVTIEEFYGYSPLIVESAGKVVIGKSSEAGHGFPVVTGNMNIRYTGSGSGTESWDVEMLCELHGNLTVNAAHGRVSALTVKSNEYCDIYARQINLVSFAGDKMTLRASVSASVTKAAAADSLRIIGLNGELPDITIQSDMIAASMIELDGKNITATGIFSVLASSCYQISAANNVDIKGTFQGGKLALTAAGAVTLGAVGDSDNPVESANIRSTGGAVNISWGAVASGALSIEGTAVSIGESITAGNINIHSSSGDILIDKAVSCSSATMEAAGNITVNGQVSGSLTATAGGSITLASFVGGSLAASATGEIAVKDVTITGNQGSSLSSEALVVFNGNAHLQNTTVSAPLVHLGKWGLALTNKSSLEGDVTAAANSYIGLNDSTITGSVSGVETVELENSTITGSVSGAGTVELVNSTIGGAGDFSLLKAEGASRINSNLVLEDDSPCFSFFLDAANGTTPVLALNGDLKLSPDVQLYCITIHLDGTDSLEAGERYALISQTGGKTPDFWEPDNVIVTGLGSSANDLSWQGGTLYFRNGAPLATATWSPGENHIWNTTDKNWTQDGREYRYKDGVDVVFNDTGMGGEVQLEGALAPKGVLVEGNCDYTFTGTGKITGEAALTKNGSGTLTVNNANEYTGGTFINGGTLAMKNGTAPDFMT